MIGRTLRTIPVVAGISAACAMNAKSFSQAKNPSSRRVTTLDLTNKVVLVTGATAGIGAACAWQFAEEGANLILVGRRDERLQSLKQEIISAFPNVDVHTVAMSVTDLQKVADLPKNLPEKFRNVDILLNNAGLALGVTSADQNDVDAAKTVLDTNVLGTIALCSAFLPGMRERGSGHLINMGSIAVRNFSPVIMVPSLLDALFYSISSYTCRATTRT